MVVDRIKLASELQLLRHGRGISASKIKRCGTLLALPAVSDEAKARAIPRPAAAFNVVTCAIKRWMPDFLHRRILEATLDLNRTGPPRLGDRESDLQKRIAILGKNNYLLHRDDAYEGLSRVLAELQTSPCSTDPPRPSDADLLRRLAATICDNPEPILIPITVTVDLRTVLARAVTLLVDAPYQDAYYLGEFLSQLLPRWLAASEAAITASPAERAVDLFRRVALAIERRDYRRQVRVFTGTELEVYVERVSTLKGIARDEYELLLMDRLWRRYGTRDPKDTHPFLEARLALIRVVSKAIVDTELSDNWAKYYEGQRVDRALT
jgi:hypothetical protein